MKKFFVGVIALSLVCGLAACGSENSSTSSRATTSTTTTTATSEEIITTTATTTTITATTSTSSPTYDDGLEFIGENTLDDGTVLKGYMYDDDCALMQVYFINNDPKTNMLNFCTLVKNAEDNLSSVDNKPSSISWWVFCEEDLVFTIEKSKQNDGTYFSQLGAIWYNDEYKKACENIEYEDFENDTDTTKEISYPTVYEDDNVTIQFYGIGKDEYGNKDSVIFYVKNKNNYEITIQCSSISLDGIQIDGSHSMSDEVAPLSKAKVYASYRSGIDNKNPSSISGVLHIIDFSGEHFDSYEATFVNVKI